MLLFLIQIACKAKYQNALTKKGVIKGSKEKEFHLTAEIARTIQYKNKKYDANGNKELYQKVK